MSGQNTYLESDGKSVAVTLSATVSKNQVAYAEGWLGISNRDGVSGDVITLSVDRREYQFTVPSGLAVSKGATRAGAKTRAVVDEHCSDVRRSALR